MNIRMILGMIFIVAFVSMGVSGQRTITLEELRKKASTPRPASTPLSSEPAKMKKSNTSIIADGSYSTVETPFVFVARDRETYMTLGSMIEGFKADNNIDFDKHAVVAAFSGSKDTGGYSVSIEMNDGKCEIEDVAPPHGAIVTEAISYPYSVTLVPVEEQAPLEVVAGDTWSNAMEVYDVISGEFQFSGGFIGMSRNFEVAGTVGVLRQGQYISFFFKVHEKVEDPVRKLFETGSGEVSEKMPEVKRLEAGDLIDRPHPPLKVNAVFNDNEVEMEFTPGERGYIVNDGFEGMGKLKAVKRLVN